MDQMNRKAKTGPREMKGKEDGGRRTEGGDG